MCLFLSFLCHDHFVLLTDFVWVRDQLLMGGFCLELEAPLVRAPRGHVHVVQRPPGLHSCWLDAKDGRRYIDSWAQELEAPLDDPEGWRAPLSSLARGRRNCAWNCRYSIRNGDCRGSSASSIFLFSLTRYCSAMWAVRMDSTSSHLGARIPCLLIRQRSSLSGLPY